MLKSVGMAIFACLLFLGCSTVSPSAPAAPIVPERPAEQNLYPKGTQLTVEQRIIQAISDFADLFELEKVPYAWGGSDPTVLTYDTQKKKWLKGSDCSGAIQYIFKKAGVKLPRVTALKMWAAWPGKKVTDDAEVWKQARLPNLIFFTWEAKKGKVPRPFGHVGLIRHNKGKTLEMSEASSSAGYFKRTAIKRGDYRDMHKEGIKIIDLLPHFVGDKK